MRDLHKAGATFPLKIFNSTAHCGVELLQGSFRTWQFSVDCKDLVIMYDFQCLESSSCVRLVRSCKRHRITLPSSWLTFGANRVSYTMSELGRSARASALQLLRLLRDHRLGVSHNKFSSIWGLDPSVLYPYMAGPNKCGFLNRTPGCAEIQLTAMHPKRNSQYVESVRWYLWHQ